MLKQPQNLTVHGKSCNKKKDVGFELFFILKSDNLLNLETKLLNYKSLSLILSLEENGILLRGSFKSSKELIQFIDNIYSPNLELSYYLIMQDLNNKDIISRGGIEVEQQQV